MKILVIDDDANKIRKLIQVLTAAGVDRTNIDIVRSAAGAQERLSANLYQIAILDLMLPRRDEDEPALQNSLALLRELTEGDSFNKPDHLIGFTAFSDIAAEARPFFTQALWTVVEFDETSNGWEEQFRRAVAYVADKNTNTPRPTYDVDICVITALQTPELDAVHALPWKWEASEPMDDTSFVRRGRMTAGKRECRILSACAPRMGSIAAALLTAKLVGRYRPRFMVMAGICAGVKQKINLGDVVLFSPSWEWASGKLVPDDKEGSYLEPAPHQLPVAEFIASRAEEMRKDKKAWLEIQEGYPQKYDGLLKMVIAPGASGPSVIAHKDTTEAIKNQHRKLTAIDMEVYGVAAAVHYASAPRPTTFAMKSVCDFADEEKKDDMQAYAAYTSAKAIQLFFERYIDQIYDLAGT